MLAFFPFEPTDNPLGETWRSVEADLVLVAVAFATEAGVRELRNKIVGRERFDATQKKWLVGIQGGVSQPKALKRLADGDNSDVRVPFGQAALADLALNAPVSFHPKLFYFENSSSEKAAVASTSANLTLSALTSNVEQILVWRGAKSDEVAVGFREWWDQLWDAADHVSEEFLAEYDPLASQHPGCGAGRLGAARSDLVLDRIDAIARGR